MRHARNTPATLRLRAQQDGGTHYHVLGGRHDCDASQQDAEIMQLLATLLLVQQDGGTHYDVLGVRHDCDASVVKAAYRRCALRYHPDKVDGADQKRRAQRRFERINEAYSTLSDPVRRQRYNLDMMGGVAPSFSYDSSAPVRVVRVVVPCTLEALGGWSAVRVDMEAALGRPHAPLHHWLPPGSLDGDRVRVPLFGGVELELQLRARPHGVFERHSEDGGVLFTTRRLPAYHNLLRRPVHMRTICGARAVLLGRGQRVRPGEVRRLRGFGLPRKGTGDRPWRARRGDLLVQLQLATARETLATALRVLGACAGGGVLLRAALSPSGRVRRALGLAPRRGRGKLVYWTGRGRPIKIWGDSRLYEWVR